MVSKQKLGVYERVDEVFHFPKFEDPILSDGQVLHDGFKPHASVLHDAGGPSMARQDMADECDINLIMQKYEATGQLPAVAGEPYYADFTSMPTDLAGSMAMMMDADRAFMTLPAKVRKEFDNDPVAFVDFASDASNLDQMREWGLAPPAPAPAAPEQAPVAPGASSGSPASPGASPSSAAPAGATQ